MNWSEAAPPTASRLEPESGALAPPLRAFSLTEHELRVFADAVIERYDAARERVAPGNPAIWAILAREDALGALVYTHPVQPRRRTPSCDGESVLGRVIDQAAQHLREPYAPHGMAAICVQCSPHSWWLTAEGRDAHVAEQHPEEAR